MKNLLLRLSLIPVLAITGIIAVPAWFLSGGDVIEWVLDWYKSHGIINY